MAKTYSQPTVKPACRAHASPSLPLPPPRKQSFSSLSDLKIAHRAAENCQREAKHDDTARHLVARCVRETLLLFAGSCLSASTAFLTAAMCIMAGKCR